MKHENLNIQLQNAIYDGNEENVYLFIQQGANINIKNENKDTPLHLAIFRENIEIIKLLIQSGS